MKKNGLFHDYFYDWIQLYKVGAVRDVTLKKYDLTYRHLRKIAPTLKLKDLDRQSYQAIINEFAMSHEKQTTLDFHHQVKSAILDAYDEGIIDKNPTRKTIIKGKEPSEKKIKYLNQYELQALIRSLNLDEGLSLDWLILLIAKTGLRFSEALGLTPADFNYDKQSISVNKTWDYKSKKGGFAPTKNESSKRTILIDWQLLLKMTPLIQQLKEDQPLFVNGRIYNSTINNLLEKHCENAGIPIITIHALRHTHASLLLYAGVSVASVAKRLGHSNITTTQKTYIHIIQELENQDMNKMMNVLSSI